MGRGTERGAKWILGNGNTLYNHALTPNPSGPGTDARQRGCSPERAFCGVSAYSAMAVCIIF